MMHSDLESTLALYACCVHEQKRVGAVVEVEVVCVRDTHMVLVVCLEHHEYHLPC